MSPLIRPNDYQDTDMTDMTLDSEWLDDYTWAATALGSSSPDFSSCSVPAAADDTELATTLSGASTIVGHERPLACKNANKPQGSCIRITTGILGSMRGNSPLCLMGSHGSPASLSSSSSRPSTATTTTATATSVDSVLSAAREAVQLIRGLLDCPTCRAGPQLQLLLTAAIAEVIARYRGVISTYYNMHHRGGGREDSELKQHLPHGELRRAPLSIGSHQIEGTMETLLVGRVVGSRLQELKVVMGEILVVQQPDSYLAGQAQQPEEEGTTKSGGGNGSNLSALLRCMYLRRDSFLAEQLTAARQELTELLRDHGTGEDCSPGPWTET